MSNSATTCAGSRSGSSTWFVWSASEMSSLTTASGSHRRLRRRRRRRRASVDAGRRSSSSTSTVSTTSIDLDQRQRRRGVVVDVLGWSIGSSGLSSWSCGAADWLPGRGMLGSINGTGPVVGDRSTYSVGSPSGVSSAITSTATSARPLERLQQAVAAVHQLLDLLAGQLAPTGQLVQHPLAVRPRLVDHLAALLLGHLELGLGVGRRVLPPAGGFDLGFFAQPLRLVGGLAQQARRPLPRRGS